MDRYSILDQNAPRNPEGVPVTASSAKDESVPPATSRKSGETGGTVHQPVVTQFAGDDSGKSLAEMAQRDLEAALQLLAGRAQYITGASGAAIALRDGSEMICRASAGPSAPELGAEVQVKSGLTGESVRTRQVLRCDDAETDTRVNRESCQALGIKSVMVVPLIREEEVIGVFELFADRANAFEERDVTALERLAEMVQTGLEHADAAKRAPEEIAAKNEEAAAKQKEAESRETNSQEIKSQEAESLEATATPVEVKIEASAEVASERASKAAQTAAVTPDAEELGRAHDLGTPDLRAQDLDKIKNCEACGFPVSGGRTLCMDCEAARISGDSPAPLASREAPAFLSHLGTGKKQSWLGSHLYTIGTVLMIVLTVVLLILRLR